MFKGEGISERQPPSPLALLKKLEPGGTLIVWKLDRLDRTLGNLITMIEAPDYPTSSLLTDAFTVADSFPLSPSGRIV